MTKFTYLCEYSNHGVPNKLNIDHSFNNIQENVSNELLSEINTNLPGGVTVLNKHPEWIRKSDIYTSDNCTINLTFVSEGAGYKNALGYYVYDKKTPPNRFSDVGEIFIIFPNASLNNKGGKLNAGDTMELVYSATTTSSGGKNFVDVANYIFPSGKGIGFVCFSNGWKLNGTNNAYVNVNRFMYSSDPSLNPESSVDKKHHAINFQSSVENDKIIYGFEDLRRDHYSDNDFNDLLFYIKPSPINAIERYSINSLEKQVYDGYVLCEDIRSGKGDFDYNDLTLHYSVIEKMLENGNIQSIRIKLQGLYRGASLNHIFGIIIPNIKTLTNCKIYRETYIYATDTTKRECLTKQIIGQGTDKVPIIENTKSFLPPGDSIFTNTVNNNNEVIPSYSILKIIFGPDGIDRSAINSTSFPYRFYLDVFREVDDEYEILKYTIYSNETYDSSIKLQNLGIPKKKKIIILPDTHSFRIPFEKRSLKAAYPRFIKHLQNESVYSSWYSENVARTEFLRDEIKHDDVHVYINIVNDNEIEPITKVGDNMIIMQPTKFKDDFSFTEQSMSDLLDENKMNTSNIMDWDNISTTEMIDKIATLIKKFSNPYIKKRGSYKYGVLFGQDRYYYVGLTSTQTNSGRLIHETKVGSEETLELLSWTGNRDYVLCRQSI